MSSGKWSASDYRLKRGYTFWYCRVFWYWKYKNWLQKTSVSVLDSNRNPINYYSLCALLMNLSSIWTRRFSDKRSKWLIGLLPSIFLLDSKETKAIKIDHVVLVKLLPKFDSLRSKNKAKVVLKRDKRPILLYYQLSEIYTRQNERDF